MGAVVLNIKAASDEILAAQQEFETVSENILLFRREYQFAMQALEKSDYLLEIALKNPQSLKNAIINVGAIGLSLNSAESLAYLVPMDGAVQLQVSYMGFIKLGVADGGILWAHAELVRKNDTFTYTGVDTKPIHTFDYFSKTRGEIVGVYCVAKTHDGSFLTRMMTYEDCIAIRNRSKLWAKKPNSGPWKTDEGEMIKKTVIKQARKTWPRGATSRLDKAIEVVNEHEGIDFTPTPPGAHKTSDVSNLLNGALGNTKDPEILKMVENIKTTCKIICSGNTEKEKREFMIRELQVTTFNELYNKDLLYLNELDLHLMRLLPAEDEPLQIEEDQPPLTDIDMPGWDQPIDGATDGK